MNCICGGEQIVHFQVCHLEIERVRAEIHLIAPKEFTGGPYLDPLEDFGILPAGEDAFPRQTRQVNNTLFAIIKEVSPTA